MKLFLTRTSQVLGRRRRSIKDENGNVCYTVNGKQDRLGIYNTKGEEVAVAWHSGAPRCIVQLGGRVVCELNIIGNRFSKESYYLIGLPWHLESKMQFLNQHFSFTDNGKQVMSFTLKMRGNELYIADPQNELLCLCVALALDYSLNGLYESNKD